MASSKLPVVFVDVPEEIIRLSGTNSTVYCNLRPAQRPETEEEKLEQQVDSFSYYMYSPVENFLCQITPKTRVVMLFQGYGPEIGTAVVDISVFWTIDCYPRIDFKHPEALEKIHGCPNFWGAFILAIARVKPETQIFAGKDKTFEIFKKIVSDSAI